MPSLVIGMRKTNAGFTLVELLVVIVIIGIAITFAVLSTGDFGHKRHFRIQAEEILENFHYARFYAALSPELISLKLDHDRLTWQTRASDNRWQTITSDKLLRSHHLHSSITISEHNLKKSDPRILISPSGEVQPFKLTLMDKSTHAKINIAIDKNNEAHIETE